MTTRTSASYRLTLTVGLCFLVALMEGLDLQAAGIAAVGIAHAFALDKMQMGWIFSAGILGLLPGALVGGMLADRYGRKRILIASVALFGLFSLATAISWDFSSLVFARLMTGVGLGAALPNLIALTSEAAGPRFRGTAVSLMYCGVPIGAALAAALGFSGLASAWQTVFWVGGVIPLLLVPLLMRWLPESQVYTQQTQVAAAPLRALFAPATASATLLLWLCYFFTLLVVYMLINWLPMLLVEQGFRPSQAAGVMFALQIGAASGTLILGALMDKLRPVVMSLLIFTAGAGYGVVIERHANGGICGGDVRHRRAKCVVCAGAAVLQHADPRHRRGNRRRSRASGGDERSAAGRENVSARYRNGRGDGGFCAGHFAGRPGGIYSDEPQITDADPGQRCLSIHPVVGVGRFDSHFRVNAVSQLWCQSLDKTWQRRRYELAALFVSDY